VKHAGRWAFGRIDVVAALADLRRRPVNYDPVEVSAADWHFDTHRTLVGVEGPGPPEQGGPWERACRLVQDYEFCPPNIVQAAYDPTVPLRGRDMLLQGRFYAVHYYVGVRVTSVADEHRDNGDRVWSWTYETLQGHLERGRMTYQVTKHHDTGQVDFVTTGYSQRAPTLSRVERLGWRLFGRWMQARFYRGCGARMRWHVQVSPPHSALVAPEGPDHMRLAPSDARPRLLDRIALRRIDPG
jgi:uncharacterized protein (UPF0548 family)